MKYLFVSLFVISQFILISCTNELNSPLNDVQISDHILEEYFITSIAFDSEGTAWIGTFEQGLLKYNGNVQHFDNNNSLLPDSLSIQTIEIDKNDIVWIGSNKGLIKYDGIDFIIYNKLNAPLFTDNVFALTIDTDNCIWFSSCMFRTGGLVKFDGINWTIFTPQNSKLPGSLISDIITDNQNNKWVTINEGDIGCSIVKINQDSLNIYSEGKIGFRPFYFGNLTNGPNDLIYASIDYSFSSIAGNTRPNIISFNGSSWKVNNPVDKNGNSLGYVGKIAVDLIGNLWASTSDYGIVVYNGQRWIYKNKNLLQTWVYDINIDQNNNVWIATSSGIYIIE